MRTFLMTCVLALVLGTAQGQVVKEKSFLVMNGYGYWHSEFADGFGSTTSFIRSVKKWWGYGLDLGIGTGRKESFFGGGNAAMLETRINRYFIAPSVYLMPLNMKRHMLYIGGSIGYAHNNIVDLQEEVMDGVSSNYWLKDKENGVGFGANAGYSFRLTEHWSIGARAYFHHFNEASVMGLLNVGITF